MVTVLGQVTTNILWTKEAEKNQEGTVKHGSLRIKVSSIRWGNSAFSCDYSLDKKNGVSDFICELPYLEVSYELDNDDYKNVVGRTEGEERIHIGELNSGENVSLEIYQPAIYIKEDYFREVVETAEGQLVKYFLKCKGSKKNVRNVRLVDSLQIPSNRRKRVIGTRDLVNKLVTLDIKRPVSVVPVINITEDEVELIEV